MVPFRCLQLISRAFLICQPSTTGTPPNRTPDPWITNRMRYHCANRWLVHSGHYYAGIFNASHFVQCVNTATCLVLTTLNSPMIELTQPGVWNSLYICDIAFSLLIIRISQSCRDLQVDKLWNAKSLIPWLDFLFRIPIDFSTWDVRNCFNILFLRHP